MGLGFNDFTAGDTLTAAQVDGYLMRQTTMVFASTSARDTALSGNLEEGMRAYASDTNEVSYYNGSSWVLIYRNSTYTPTLANMAIGSGGSAANNAEFVFSYGLLQVRGSITFGTSGATLPGASTETIAFPSGFTNTDSFGQTVPVGLARYDIAAGSSSYVGYVMHGTGDETVSLRYPSSDIYTSISATAPGTWAAGDTIVYQFSVGATATV